MNKELEAFLNQKIVMDTRSSWIYIGTLEKITGNCAVLTDVDVHDGTDSSTSKELYIFDTRTTGIKSNRKSVHINLNWVISFSLLEDVKP
jgi:hypothetical protein